jgi:phage gpG-like protein
MPGPGFEGEFIGFDMADLARIVVKIGDRDLTPAMKIVAEQLVAGVNDEFQTAGHGSWEPLAESTIAKRRGSVAQILMDTGRFAASVQASHGADFAEASTDVFYAVFHVGDGPRTKIPRRDPFVLSDDVQFDAIETILNYLVEGTA